MLRTSLIAELVRSQPRLTFWVATLAQAGLWWLIPSALYSAPPGDLPTVLAVGHEYLLGSPYGPPLAFWAAELSFTIAGSTGVYLLSQACVVLTYYAVFRLARAVVGIHHAVFAVLLMVGISAFTAPTPNFGPAVLAMPFTAFALLYFWRALGERRRSAWFVTAVFLGLLLLTTYAGLVLLGAIMVFLVASRRGRRAMLTAQPWIATMIIVAVLFPHLMWFDTAGGAMAILHPDFRAAAASTYLVDWLGDVEALLLAHAGFLILIALSISWGLGSDDQSKVPAFARSLTDPFARRFVVYFAIVPAAIATVIADLAGERQLAGGGAPFLVLSGLAVVMLAGNVIRWHRPRVVAIAWTLLLLVPPLSAATAILVLPWLGTSGAEVARPARDIGQFFAASFERRNAAPLAVVTGDQRLASLIALGAPTRPSLFIDAAPERSPWVSMDDVRRKGAIVVWPSPDTRPDVPPDIAARFPGLVAEVPHAFERRVQGRLPLLRIGWGVVRPQAPVAER